MYLLLILVYLSLSVRKWFSIHLSEGNLCYKMFALTNDGLQRLTFPKLCFHSVCLCCSSFVKLQPASFSARNCGCWFITFGWLLFTAPNPYGSSLQSAPARHMPTTASRRTSASVTRGSWTCLATASNVVWAAIPRFPSSFVLPFEPVACAFPLQLTQCNALPLTAFLRKHSVSQFIWHLQTPIFCVMGSPVAGKEGSFLSSFLPAGFFFTASCSILLKEQSGPKPKNEGNTSRACVVVDRL